jgi:hypothetical protein
MIPRLVPGIQHHFQKGGHDERSVRDAAGVGDTSASSSAQEESGKESRTQEEGGKESRTQEESGEETHRCASGTSAAATASTAASPASGSHTNCSAESAGDVG